MGNWWSVDLEEIYQVRAVTLTSPDNHYYGGFITNLTSKLLNMYNMMYL